MILLLTPPECLSHTGDDGYPCLCVMLTADRIAHSLPRAQARAVVRQLLFEQCSSALGLGDREELLERVFAKRDKVAPAFHRAVGLTSPAAATSPSDSSSPHAKFGKVRDADSN